jgi:hypothetical protein
MWQWLEGLQGGAPAFVGSLTGAAIGLIALVLGALFNAHLNRKRDDRLRREDTRSVAAALRAELDGIHSALVHNAERLESEKSGYVGPDIAHLIRIMPEIMPKAGLLDTRTIREVVDAYTMIEQHSQNCMLLGATYNDTTFPGRRMVVIPAMIATNIAKVNRHTAEEVKKAIGRLDDYLS